MKLRFIFLGMLFTLSISVIAQTPSIAAKSRLSVDYAKDTENDLFGLGPEHFNYFNVYKVERLKNACIVEHKVNAENSKLKKIDTICDHPYFTGQYTMDEILLFYPKGTLFVGFKDQYFNDSIPVKKQGFSVNQTLLIGLILLFFYKMYQLYAVKRK